ncbi:DUF4097 domain-containing protein [Candidatus Latescibacterota bacterium]
MRKVISRFGFIVVFICLIGALCGFSPVQAAEEEFHQTYTLKAGETVSVQSINGTVDVSSWNKDVVDVYAVKKTRYGRDKLDDVEIVISTNDGLVIETEHLTKNPRVSVNYTIKLPKNINLALAKSTNGAIEVDGVSGDAVIRSTNGQIQIDNVNGIIDAQTTNGKISIENTRGLKQARTTNGSINVEITELPDTDVEIKTTNGSVDMYLPEDLNADLELRTNNGRIRANDFRLLVNEISKNYISGQLGDGGKQLIVRTTNGSISINKL